MNYKANISVYKHKGELSRQLTVLFDESLYERLEKASTDLNLSMNAIVRTLLDHGFKHCNIETEQDDTCQNCKEYVPDEFGNYVCCEKRSKYFASFRPKDSWCVFHKRGNQ